MKICSVIVTYGDRFHLLRQVINACFKEGVDKVIVVDNASAKSSKKQLQEFEKQNKNKLKVIYLDENTGSAGGYKIGLEEAYKCKECEFIWLLDDDNEPQKNSLKVLKDYWNHINEKNKEEKTALLSYRPDRVHYKEAIITNSPDFVLGRKNGFLGFDIFDLPKKTERILKKKIGLPTFKENSKIRSGKVSAAPYGGMFFHKKLLDKIKYPKEEFFLYADDYEWSYRITKRGGQIILLLDSKIKDIDISLGLRGKKNTSLFYNLMNKLDCMRLYYSTRNRIVFEKELVSNRFIYSLNRIIFLLILKFYKNKKNAFNYNCFLQALKDAKNNRMGKSYEN